MLVVLSITCLLVLTAVGVHYKALTLLTSFLSRRQLRVRRWIAVSVLGVLIAHIVEVSLFAVGFQVLVGLGKYGTLTGELEHNLSDYWYFSFVAYTSLGFGDITPDGVLRLMTAVETLTGLILIAWSASFLFMTMQHLWEQESRNRPSDN